MLSSSARCGFYSIVVWLHWWEGGISKIQSCCPLWMYPCPSEMKKYPKPTSVKLYQDNILYLPFLFLQTRIHSFMKQIQTVMTVITLTPKILNSTKRKTETDWGSMFGFVWTCPNTFLKLLTLNMFYVVFRLLHCISEENMKPLFSHLSDNHNFSKT